MEKEDSAYCWRWKRLYMFKKDGRREWAVA